MKKSHKIIQDLISSIRPWDETERLHIDLSLKWLDHASEIYRTAKPAIPDMHLVAYFAVIDLYAKKTLLVDHKKANLWLPPGGHVEPEEHPQDTVQREIKEELGIDADFLFLTPFFLTVSETVGNTTPHTDVSLWYVVQGCQDHIYNYDEKEFNQIRWFPIQEIPWKNSEPHLSRFINKLSKTID